MENPDDDLGGKRERRLKILMFSYLFPPGQGGVGFSNLSIAEGLHKRGHQLYLIVPNCFSMKEFASRLPFGVRIVPKWPFTPMHSLSKRGYLNWFFVPWYTIIIKREILKNKPDVLILPDETSNAFWSIISKFIQIPFLSYWSVPVFTREQMIRPYSIGGFINWRLKKIIKLLLWSNYKNSKKILVVSNSTKQKLLEEDTSIEAKVEIVPRSLDDRFLKTPYDIAGANSIKKKYGIRQNEFVLLSVSRLLKDKGIDDCIKAVKRLILKGKKVKYIIVGSGEYGQCLKLLVKELNLNSTVMFTGELNHFELVNYYDVCDLFLLPSKRGFMESFGRVFIEAGARGKPSIGCNEGGMPEVIDDMVSGFLVEPGDIEQIIAKIEDTIENPERTFLMGLNAREKVRKKYSTQVIAEKIEKQFITALGPMSLT